MYGAILGDMIGAPYEFDRGRKTKDFPLFSRDTEFTDDTVMTIAVCEALLQNRESSDEELRQSIVQSMQDWGHRIPDAGYGGMFYQWLYMEHPHPYGSFGNGSAMRVSAAGWLYDTLEETRRVARLTAEVTHNHPEGIKGAEAAASAIFLARTGSSKDEIRDYITDEFGYDLSRTCDEIRPYYHHVESCQETVPEAITAFLEGTDFEDVIRTAVSLGGDCDTLTCIAGGIAEAFYGVPGEMKVECRRRLPEEILEVLDRFVEATEGTLLRDAIHAFEKNRTEQTLSRVIQILSDSLVWVPCNAVMSDSDYANLEKMVMDAVNNEGPDSLIGQDVTSRDSVRMIPDILQSGEEYFFPVFSSVKDMGEYGEHFSKIQKHFMEVVPLALNNPKDVYGIVVNAFSEPFVLPREYFDIGAGIPRE